MKHRSSPPAPPALARDPGLQPERTGLAWRRTAFISLLNALLLLRAYTLHGEVPLLCAGLILLLSAGGMWRQGNLRGNQTVTGGHSLRNRMLLTAGAVVLAAAIAAVETCRN